ncbi:Cadmium, cobalt and zinc/H(+)-K(+) antiporter [compost metagenome]
MMLVFEWYIFDPIVSVVVALLILKGAWGVITQSVHVLMEGTPSGVELRRSSLSLRESPALSKYMICMHGVSLQG